MPRYVVEPSETVGSWKIYVPCDGGGTEVTIFAGENAKQRAYEYAAWKNNDICPTCGQVWISNAKT